jgi:polyferredoxin
MGIIFFGIVTPTSIIMKIFNKDILKLKKNNKKNLLDTKAKE